MKWIKLGHVFCASGEHPWMLSHAANPVAEWRHGDVYRVYFSARDKDRRAHIGYVDIDLQKPQEILAISDEPVVAPGAASVVKSPSLPRLVPAVEVATTR